MLYLILAEAHAEALLKMLDENPDKNLRYVREQLEYEKQKQEKPYPIDQEQPDYQS